MCETTLTVRVAYAEPKPEKKKGSPVLPRSGEENSDHGLSEKDFREAKRKFEIAYLRRQLSAHRWNISRTAATIGLHRQSLQERLRELGIRRPGQELSEDVEE